MERSILLAKSNPKISLNEHIDDCLSICRQLSMVISNIPVEDKASFWNIVRKSLIMHDTGKGHVEFQKILLGKASLWYHQRHELFSIYFIHNSNLSESEKTLVSFGVLGHHKSLGDLFDFVNRNYYNDEDWDEEGLSYADECDKLCYEEIKEILDRYELNLITKNVPCIKSILRLAKNKNIEGKANIENILFIGAIKHCDHMASAGIKHLYRLEKTDFAFLYKYPFFTHQLRDAEASCSVILNAPTGAGKTEAALVWLKNQLEHRGQGRVYYILPYTASINAMYKRLNSCIGDSSKKVGLLHGNLMQYLDLQMENHSIDTIELQEQVEDFKSMLMPLKIVTPFQLLKHLFGIKGFEKGIFEWSGGYFIIDEIHAYEVKVFAQIIVLLSFAVQYLKVRVHIMTATLPTFMRCKIASVIGPYQEIIADKQLYLSFRRHRLFCLDGLLTDYLDNIQVDINQGKKVLVVCNTVDESQMVYKYLHASKKVLLHGRFCAEDRFKNEVKLKEDDVSLLVGTQAIEISLDVDFDLIYTAPAPLDALLQRFGRVNRKREKGICPCYVFKERNDADKYIYKNAGVIERTLEVLKQIEQDEGGIIQENKLQALIDVVYPCWSEEEQEDFSMTKTLFEDYVEKDLRPLEYSAEREEEFYKQFDDKKVIPAALVPEYQSRISNLQFVKAEGLLVSISKRRFANMLHEGNIEQKTFVYSKNEDKQIISIKQYVINSEYDERLGLVFSETEKQIGGDIFL